jgi:hypothetical protein
MEIFITPFTLPNPGVPQNNYQQQCMTRIRDNKVTESKEYFQQFMTKVRDNRVRKGKGGNEYF